MLRQIIVKKEAREDAAAGIESLEDRITATLGLRPELDVHGNPEHARLVAALDRSRIEELREDLVQIEATTPEQPPVMLLNVALAVMVAIEFVGAFLITRALGLPPAERLPLGIGLATTVVGLTALVSHRAAADRASIVANGGSAPPPWGLKRSGIVLAYLIVTGALVVIRLRNAGDDQATSIELFAEAALLVATTLGPAAAAAWLARTRAGALAASKDMRTVQRRLRDAEAAYERARTAIDRIHRAGGAWDAAVARLRAMYRSQHRLQSARRGGGAEASRALVIRHDQ